MKKLILTGILALSVMGCASANKKTFLAELAASATADAGMKGYGAYYKVAIQNPTAYNTSIQNLNAGRAEATALSVKIGTSVETVEALRISASTNSAVKPSLAIALQILSENSSNLLQTVNTLTH